MSLDGIWNAVEAEFGGQHIDEEYVSAIKLIIAKDQCELYVGGNTDKGVLKFIPYVVPMAFDFTSTEGTNKGKIFKSIYKTTGGFLIVCYNLITGDRPKTFISTVDNQFYLVRYKRAE